MAHFQLKTEPALYSTLLGGTRLFLSGTSGQEAILIEMGKKVVLEIGGALPANATPAITQTVLPITAAAAGLLTTTGVAGPNVVSVAPTRRFVTLTAVHPGAASLTIGGVNPLIVFVGSFKNHTGMEHDLIANVFRSADPEKMHTLNRMLFNNDDNLFNENNTYNIKKWKPLACGTVSKVGGSAVFYRPLNYDYKAYYKAPIAGKTRDDVMIEKKLLDRGRTAIQARLAKGIPSIVGLIYKPSAIQKGRINVTGAGGHTILVIGCSKDGTKFMFIDVWKGGSKMKYEGGYAGLTFYPSISDGIGMFEVGTDATRNIEVLASVTPGSFSGPTNLEVVAGPLN